MENISIITEEEIIDNHQNQSQENERYSCERFIQTLKQFHSQTILFYCPYDETTLTNFYMQISEQQQTQTLDQATVKQFIFELKETNRQSLTKQIQFYQSEMKKILQNNVKIISRKEFMKITDHFYSENQLLTEIMIENSRQANYIACDKVLALTEQVRAQIQQNLHLGLTMSNLKTRTLKESEIDRTNQKLDQITEIQSLKQSKFLSSLEEFSLKKLINRYLQFWHRKLNFFRQFVGDEQIREDMQSFIQKISEQEDMILDETTNLITANQEMKSKCLQFQNIYQNLKEQEVIYENVIEQQQNQTAQLKEIIAKGEKENTRYVNQNNTLALALEQTKSNIIQLAFEHQQTEKELQNYKTSYAELYTQYQKLTQKHSQQTILKKQQQSKRIFSDRTLKEQLEDAVAKLERTLMLREKERKLFKEKEENQINIITNLETKLEELQKQLKEKNQHLSDYVKLSNLMIPIQKSILKASMMSNAKSEIEQCSIYSLTNFNSKIRNEKNILGLPKNTRFSKINIGMAAVVQEAQEKQNILDPNFLPNEQNLTDIISQDNGLNKKSPHKQFAKTNKIDVADCIDTQSHDLNKKNVQINIQTNSKEIICAFKSKGIIINSYGLKFETTILLTAKRFCYFDTKVRMMKFLPVANIKHIVFCYHNSNLFVIKVKNAKQLDSGKHIVNDMIFSIRKRNKLVNFLQHNYRETLKDYNIEVSFKREDNIFLSIDDKQLNLKLKIPGMSHPLRLCLSGESVFYGKILQADGFFNFYKQCCFIIQPAAIFCFEGTEIMQIQSKRQFLFLLPLVESMKIKQKINSTEAFGRKLKISYFEDQSWQRTYSLIFFCKEDMKNFIKALELQNQQNHELKLSLFKKQLKIFDYKDHYLQKVTH